MAKLTINFAPIRHYETILEKFQWMAQVCSQLEQFQVSKQPQVYMATKHEHNIK